MAGCDQHRLWLEMDFDDEPARVERQEREEAIKNKNRQRFETDVDERGQ